MEEKAKINTYPNKALCAVRLRVSVESLIGFAMRENGDCVAIKANGQKYVFTPAELEETARDLAQAEQDAYERINREQERAAAHLVIDETGIVTEVVTEPVELQKKPVTRRKAAKGK
jgi:hypothetical protein